MIDMLTALIIPEEKLSRALICDNADCIEFGAALHSVFPIKSTKQFLWAIWLKWHIAKLANPKETISIRTIGVRVDDLIFFMDIRIHEV